MKSTQKTAIATVREAGENVIIARFLDRVVPLTLVVPLRDKPIDLSDLPRRNFIDGHVLHRLAVLRIPVSPRADPASLIRRVYLDLTGTLPNPDAVAKYQTDEKNWHRLIEQLIESDAYVDYWTYQFAKLLRIRSQPKDTRGAFTFHRWLGEQLRQGTRYDELARTLLTAAGDSHQYGPANFYRTAGGPRKQAEYISQVFMGVRLRCANCHNHPLDRWTQDDYHGFAAMFAKIERGRIIKVGPRGDVTHPRTGNPATPKIPGDRFLDPKADGRGQFAEWLTQKEKPLFCTSVRQPGLEVHDGPRAGGTG